MITNPFEVIDARLKHIECLLLEIKYPPPSERQRDSIKNVTASDSRTNSEKLRKIGKGVGHG
jgi:hypothetical protein